MKIFWSPLALQRIGEIADYTAEDNAAAAVKWVNAVFEKVAGLQQLPFSGRVVPEINHLNIREMLYGYYRIVYRIKGKVISMLTVRHGKKMLPIDEIESHAQNL